CSGIPFSLALVRTYQAQLLNDIRLVLAWMDAAAGACMMGIFMRRILLVAFLLLSAYTIFAQQEYVSRYDGFAGFAYLDSRKLNLAERGFITEFGVNVNRWLVLGVDYSIFTGHSDIRGRDLTPALQQQLAALVPPGVPVSVPFDSTTYTFTAG